MIDIRMLQDGVLYATEPTAILHASERNSAVILRLLCGNSAVRAGKVKTEINTNLKTKIYVTSNLHGTRGRGARKIVYESW